MVTWRRSPCAQVIGLAEIYSYAANVITAESSSLFLTMTAQLAVSMENARLYTQLQNASSSSAALSGGLFQAEDGERRQMAYESTTGWRSSSSAPIFI